MITDPRSSLMETKWSRKVSSFPAEMSLIKLIVAANRQSPVKISAFMPQEHQIRKRSDKRENTNSITLVWNVDSFTGEIKPEPRPDLCPVF